MRKFIKDFFTKDWTIYDKVLCVANAALLGLVVGFVASPIKKGLHILSHNGNENGRNSGNHYAEKLEEKKKEEEQDV